MSEIKNIKEPSQARARARREKILSATQALLLSGGQEAVTTTAIAAAAEIPVGSVYRYFKDRHHILRTLYETAYAEVEVEVLAAIDAVHEGQSFRVAHRSIIRAFWKAAREHPSFRPLTRWANSASSLWEVTPGPNSDLGVMTKRTLAISGINLPKDREDVIMRTLVTTLSVLIDQAIEEDDEQVAEALITEITEVFAAYVDQMATA